MDVYFGRGKGHNNILSLGDGKGAFRDAPVSPLTDDVTKDFQTHAVRLADMDNDGDVDVVLANWGQRDAIFLQCGAGFM